jgi:hypothetical protein
VVRLELFKYPPRYIFSEPAIAMPVPKAAAPLPPKFFAQVVAPLTSSFNAKASVPPIFVKAGVVRLAVLKYPPRYTFPEPSTAMPVPYALAPTPPKFFAQVVALLALSLIAKASWVPLFGKLKVTIQNNYFSFFEKSS